MCEDFIKGWKMACRMSKKSAEWFLDFNEEGWDIHKKKGREMPANLKELDALLWKAFRAGQAHAADSILGSIQNRDWSKWDYDEPQKEPENIYG